MGVSSISPSLRRARRARRFRRHQRGLVSVVGTLLALLLFFALFGIFLTQYVPLWMTENEATYTNQGIESMADFKSNVDLQYTLGGPASFATPFTLSSQGIPLVAQPTVGELQFIPSSPNVFADVASLVGPGGGGPFTQNISTGVLVLSMPNRYYSPATLQFEDDAILEAQGGTTNQIVAFPPPLSVARFASNTTVTMSLVQLYGNASAAVQQGTQDAFSHLRFSDTEVISNTPSMWFNVSSIYPCAWLTFFTQTMAKAGFLYTSATSGGTSGHFHLAPQTLSCPYDTGLPTFVSLELFSVTYLTLYYAGIQVTVGIGGT